MQQRGNMHSRVRLRFGRGGAARQRQAPLLLPPPPLLLLLPPGKVVAAQSPQRPPLSHRMTRARCPIIPGLCSVGWRLVSMKSPSSIVRYTICSTWGQYKMRYKCGAGAARSDRQEEAVHKGGTVCLLLLYAMRWAHEAG